MGSVAMLSFPYKFEDIEVNARHVDEWRANLATDWFREHPEEALWIRMNTVGCQIKAAAAKGQVVAQALGAGVTFVAVRHSVILFFSSVRDRDQFAAWMSERNKWEVG